MRAISLKLVGTAAALIALATTPALAGGMAKHGHSHGSKCTAAAKGNGKSKCRPTRHHRGGGGTKV